MFNSVPVNASATWERIWNYAPHGLLLCCWLLFALLQRPMPLQEDQLTSATMTEFLIKPSIFNNDPLWGQDNLSLPLNAGTLIFVPLEALFGSLELGIVIALIIWQGLFLVAAYYFFNKISGSRLIGIGLALLSSLEIRSAAATFWGIGSPDSFVARTLFIPLVPLFFHLFLKLLDKPSPKYSFYLFVGLGLSALIHPISSGYLFLAFLLVLFIEELPDFKTTFAGGAGFLTGAALFAIPFLLQGSTANRKSLQFTHEFVQEVIEYRYFWAFNPSLGEGFFQWMLDYPLQIIALVLIPWFIKNQTAQRLIKITGALLIATLSLYWIQFYLLELLKKPFSFIELGRGFRFLPFVAFSLIGVFMARIRTIGTAPVWEKGIPIVFLILSVTFYAWSQVGSAQSNHHHGATCSDPIFKKVQTIPDEVLLVVPDIEEARYCSQRSVYVIFKDGAVAYYNGHDTLISWYNRYRRNEKFFETPGSNTLDIIRPDGVTHILSQVPLPDDPSWILIDRSALYYLYAIRNRED